MTDGEIRKHGEIENLGMMAMTMAFHVKAPAMLDKVKAGDKVKFKAENVGGQLVITELQTSK
jgi:Cu(I)/Ag(I) efflux system protein CusF